MEIELHPLFHFPPPDHSLSYLCPVQNIPFQNYMKKRLTQIFVFLSLLTACLLFGEYVANPSLKVRYIWADAEGYYMYLPAMAIYEGDFRKIPVRTEVHFKAYPGTDKIFTKYNYGVALMQSPFYFGAYALRLIQGKDPNVYDAQTYDWSILVAACFYGLLGLFILTKSLKRHFSSKWVIGLTLLSVFLGTNLLHYMTGAPGMSHAYSFFLAAALVYLTPSLFESATWRKYLLGGFVAGLIVLIRPTNIVLLLYPLFYGIHSRESVNLRLGFIKKHWLKIALAAAVSLLLWVPQMAYWHYLSGNWFIDAYYTESFKFWDKPLVNYVLFSVLNGYFIYNPIMLFPVVCLFFMLRKNHLNSWGTLAVFWLSTYVFSSWWCWWFGGSYGHRCYVELLPVLVFPMAFFFEKVWFSKWKLLKTSALVLSAVLVFYNVRMVMLYHPTWSDMQWNWEKYWVVFDKVFFF